MHLPSAFRSASFWLLLPATLFMISILVLPLFNLMELSVLQHSSRFLWIQEFTFENYMRAADSYYVQIFARSLEVTLITTLACVLMGYPLAYFLARSSPTTLSVGMFLLLMPLMVSIVVLAFGWIVVLGRDGLLNQLLLEMGMERLNIVYTGNAVIIALVQLVLPLMVLPLMASIERIDIEVEEASVNLGSNLWQRFYHVILPLSMPGLVSGFVLCFAMAISVVVIPSLLGGRRGRMIGNEIYDQVLTGMNWPLASAISALLIIAILSLLGFSGYMVHMRRSKYRGGLHG